MKALACVALLTTAGLAQADPTTDLRKLCAEQERQIVALEKKIESLHSELALERRRSRGPAPEATPTAVVSAQPGATYEVRNGDTLSSIARQYKTTSSALMKDNGITDPTRLRVGQTIKIPADVEPAKEVAKAPAPAKDVAKTPAPAPVEAKAPVSPTYKVQSGDTFYKIARTHSLTVAKLETLNPGIDPSRIVIGQELAVSGTPRKAPAPALAEAGTRTITTKAPETTAPAARKETPKSPAPKAEARKEEPKPAPAPESKPAPKTISSIIVMEEISFEKFAGKHGTTTEQLNALNGLTLKDSTVLAKGSELYVPGR